jgi:sulfide dehydrogenase cytochrome subunit
MLVIRTVVASLALAALAWWPAVQAGADGPMLGRACAGCHGTDGRSAGPATPSIAAIDAEHFVETMQAFRDGKRPATVMDRIAKGYADDELAAMGAFFAQQTRGALDQPFNAGLAKLGGELHGRFCEKCHAKNGTEADDSAVLAGQPVAYLLWSLEEFAAGARPMAREMRKRLQTVHVRHGDEGLNALANFYGRQGAR